MKPKSKTATSPEKKDRRGWPKGKPRKPKFTTEITPEEQEAIRTQKAKPDPMFAHGRSVPASEAWASIPITTASEAIASRQRTIAHPHKLGAEWQFMDLDEWRRNPTCVEYLQKLRDEPMFRRFLGMLHGYASRNGAEAPQTETSASIALGKIQGRREILEVIDVAAQPDQPLFNPTDLPVFADEGEPLGII